MTTPDDWTTDDLEADDWALAPEGVPGDDPFESPWLAEPGAFLAVEALEPGGEWADTVDSIDYAEESEPFALPAELTEPVAPDEITPAPFEADVADDADDAGWDFWSPSNADPGWPDG